MFNVYSIYIHFGILSGWNVDWNTPMHWMPGCHSQNWWWRNAATGYHWPNQRSSKAVKSRVVATQIFFMFTPKIGEDEPILTHIFSKGVETFNHQPEIPGRGPHYSKLPHSPFFGVFCVCEVCMVPCLRCFAKIGLVCGFLGRQQIEAPKPWEWWWKLRMEADWEWSTRLPPLPRKTWGVNS